MLGESGKLANLPAEILDRLMTSLDISLASLRSDADFVERARRLGLETLGDVLDVRLPPLRKKKDFSYMWYAELLELLKEQGLLDEFQHRQL